jgi:hypothetical protein
MRLFHNSDRLTRWLAGSLALFSLVLTFALMGTWYWLSHLTLTLPLPENPVQKAKESGPVSPLLVEYKLDLPGRGELFPALATGAREYWPLAMLSITNTSDRPVLQLVTAQVREWSEPLQQTVIVGPRETRTLQLSPNLLSRTYRLQEIQKATFDISVTDLASGTVHAESRPVLIHSANDVYWGKQFANAQVIARWVTPHDPSVLVLVSDARRHIRNGRMPGYNSAKPGNALKSQVTAQARAVFEAVRDSGFNYVSSIFTFGDFTSNAQRIRLPRETLTLDTANCIDVSVAFAAAIENLGMNPVVVIVPGHAFVGVRYSQGSSETLYLDLTVLPRGTFQQAIARASGWLKDTPADKVLTIDVAAARRMGIFPMPTLDQEPQVTTTASTKATD